MSPVSQLVCLFMVVVVLVPAMSLEKRYSNSWAVEVKGGHEVAEILVQANTRTTELLSNGHLFSQYKHRAMTLALDYWVLNNCQLSD